MQIIVILNSVMIGDICNDVGFWLETSKASYLVTILCLFDDSNAVILISPD